jgi:hypothetical protein
LQNSAEYNLKARSDILYRVLIKEDVPMNGNSAQINPQGLDISDIIKAVLPIVMTTLSASPQVSPQMSIGGGLTFNPFSAAPSSASLSPQGFDIGEILKHVLPVVLSTLSASPQGGMQPQSSGPLSPQGFDLGSILKTVLPIVKTVVPIVMSTLSAGPQGSMQPQSSGALSPQGFDIGSIVGAVLPIVLSSLSASPQAAMQPQSTAPLAPQGFDLGSIIKTIVPIVMSTLSASPQTRH